MEKLCTQFVSSQRSLRRCRSWSVVFFFGTSATEQADETPTSGAPKIRRPQEFPVRSRTARLTPPCNHNPQPTPRLLYNNTPCDAVSCETLWARTAESRYCTLSIQGVLCDYLRRIEQAHISTERVEGRYTHRLRLIKSRPIEFGTP